MSEPLTPNRAIAIVCPELSEDERLELYAYIRAGGGSTQPMPEEIARAAGECWPEREIHVVGAGEEAGDA